MRADADIGAVEKRTVGIDKNMLAEDDAVSVIAMKRWTDDGRGRDTGDQRFEHGSVSVVVSRHHTQLCQQLLGMLETGLHARIRKIRPFAVAHLPDFGIRQRLLFTPHAAPILSDTPLRDDRY